MIHDYNYIKYNKHAFNLESVDFGVQSLRSNYGHIYQGNLQDIKQNGPVWLSNEHAMSTS